MNRRVFAHWRLSTRTFRCLVHDDVGVGKELDQQATGQSGDSVGVHDPQGVSTMRQGLILLRLFQGCQTEVEAMSPASSAPRLLIVAGGGG
jgi:hypothetical protein